MSEKTFLVEIGTEELPPKALRSLAESFAANFTAELDNAGLAHGTVQWFAAPRRLALKVANLAEAQPDREIEKRGPAIAQAFDAEGKPSKAAEGWARGCGITVDQAERLTTDKGEWLLYRAHVKGESTEALLPNMVATSLAKLPIPKLMRWGASDVHFVRPVHTVTLLLGDKVIPATILGIQSDRVIREIAALWASRNSLSTMPISIRKFCVSAGKSSPITKNVRRRLKPMLKKQHVRLAVTLT